MRKERKFNVIIRKHVEGLMRGEMVSRRGVFLNLLVLYPERGAARPNPGWI